mmetsp:Transcript_81023/g.251408  ORF Transcript_81023/g.251408 Transcript_81023/m.251408 type:complete len:241 (-) Transcript_81023:95-817(-)
MRLGHCGPLFEPARSRAPVDWLSVRRGCALVSSRPVGVASASRCWRKEETVVSDTSTVILGAGATAGVETTLDCKAPAEVGRRGRAPARAEAGREAGREPGRLWTVASAASSSSRSSGCAAMHSCNRPSSSAVNSGPDGPSSSSLPCPTWSPQRMKLWVCICRFLTRTSLRSSALALYGELRHCVAWRWRPRLAPRSPRRWNAVSLCTESCISYSVLARSFFMCSTSFNPAFLPTRSWRR